MDKEVTQETELRDIEDFPNRGIVLLDRANIKTVGDLLLLDRTELLKIKGIGYTTANRIEDVLHENLFLLKDRPLCGKCMFCGYKRLHRRVGNISICYECLEQLLKPVL